MTFKQARWEEKLLFEYDAGNNKQDDEPAPLDVPRELIRERVSLPNLSEPEVVRHFTRLTQMSYGIDLGPVPLGSCTMKYNPKIATKVLQSNKIRNVHPFLLKAGLARGILRLMFELQEWLKEITGMDACSLQPPAGASGELSGVLMIKAFHNERGEKWRDEMIVPDSAHGSNPASSAMGGFKVIRVQTDERGNVDIEGIKAVVGNRTAGLMLTNPNTLGLFEERILEIAKSIHEFGGVLYYDGANLNGIIGIARPGDMGFDIVHLNLHKTFSAPHGGGGPGAGAVCAKGELAKYLPGYIVEKKNGDYTLSHPEKSIGHVMGTMGNLPGMVYAYVFLLSYGEDLWKVALHSSLNINYFLSLLKGVNEINLPFGEYRFRKHEGVISVKKLTEETGVTADDLAKFLLERGLHAPTIYFPLIVEEAMMFEFTETEPMEVIDEYASAIKEAVELAHRDPKRLKELPKSTASGRLDAVRANHPQTMRPSVKFGVKDANERKV
ncbi:MAG: aminomethyl-transferring glycine dehydrogenase subunit GcvPB [Desulfurococcales archaeon]